MQHIALMSRIDICYTSCHLEPQTMATTIPDLQSIKRCIQYMGSNPHKRIFYPSNYYDVSNSTRLTWSGDTFEDYTTHNFLECHQDVDNAIIINRRR